MHYLERWSASFICNTNTLHGAYAYIIHCAALITQQSLAAKLTLKYQIYFPAISTVYWMNIPQSTCKVL